METEEKGQLPFLDVLLSKQSTSDNQCSCVTSVFRKKTYNGLLTNYFSFTPFKYKLGLIKTLIDRAYKINNTTQGFQNDIKNLSVILKRNLFPSWLIDKSVKDYLRNLALCLVLKILFPSLLNHVLCTSLRVRAVELVILVKPIGIFTHVLMNIFFGTKIHMFLNILIVLGIVGTVVMPPVLKL